MNRYIIIPALILVVPGAVYLYLNSNDREQRHVAPARAGTPPARQESMPDPSAEQQRRAAMRAEYDKLEQARDALRQQLGKVRTRLWGVRVPPARAREIQEQMFRGHSLLKNPPLLGAFSSVAEIAGEIRKVDEVRTGLEGLEAEIQGYPTDRTLR